VFLFPKYTAAQLRVDTIHDANFLIKKVLMGDGVLVDNIRFQGASTAVGFFKNDSTRLPFSKGILLTTGLASDAIGPNKSPATTTTYSYTGNKYLEGLAKGKTYDVALIEFEFTPSEKYVSFKYVFASEEYTEYVGQNFNDVFGFFVSGGKLKNPVNIAVVPGTRTPVTVNNINPYQYSEYYIDNNLWDKRNTPIPDKHLDFISPETPYSIAYDGFTVPIAAEIELEPGITYKMVIAIADVGDLAWDSAVFLEANSFSSRKSLNVVTTQEPIPETNRDNQTLQSGQFYFDNNASSTTPNHTETLDKLIETLNKNSEATVVLSGHTDNIGTEAFNNILSKKRAKTIQKALLDAGIQANRIQMEWHSERIPTANNGSEEGRANNRRVEYTVQTQ